MPSRCASTSTSTHPNIPTSSAPVQRLLLPRCSNRGPRASPTRTSRFDAQGNTSRVNADSSRRALRPAVAARPRLFSRLLGDSGHGFRRRREHHPRDAVGQPRRVGWRRTRPSNSGEEITPRVLVWDTGRPARLDRPHRHFRFESDGTPPTLPVPKLSHGRGMEPSVEETGSLTSIVGAGGLRRRSRGSRGDTLPSRSLWGPARRVRDGRHGRGRGRRAREGRDHGQGHGPSVGGRRGRRAERERRGQGGSRPTSPRRAMPTASSDEGEACDGHDFGDKTCESLGLHSGSSSATRPARSSSRAASRPRTARTRPTTRGRLHELRRLRLHRLAACLDPCGAATPWDVVPGFFTDDTTGAPSSSTPRARPAAAPSASTTWAILQTGTLFVSLWSEHLLSPRRGESNCADPATELACTTDIDPNTM